MSTDFAPRLDILPPPQRRLWDELADIPAEFVLYGGTGLALREALDQAPPGIIDPRSWAYWNSKLGRYPAPPCQRGDWDESAPRLIDYARVST